MRRKLILSFSSLFVILLWAVIVLAFCVKYGHTLDALDNPVKNDMARYGIGLGLLLMHLTWTIATTNQIFMAYAMSDEIGSSYVQRLKDDYKYPLLFTVVDIGYILFFAIKFGRYFV